MRIGLVEWSARNINHPERHLPTGSTRFGVDAI
jgi:hypothetical protein